MVSASTRTFGYQDDKSSKFWEINQAGSTVSVRYGKTGANGQTQEKVFSDAEAATRHVERLVKEKTGKGYVEISGASSTSAGTAMPSGLAADQAADPTQKAKTKKTPAVERAKSKSPAQNPDASPDSLMAFFGKDDATNRLLAKHPRAREELLEKLSHSGDKATRRAVASNPNTSPEALVRLGQQFPEEFLANPALDLLLMVNPALMEEVSNAFLVRVLKRIDCPPALLTWAADHSDPKVQLAVAMNASLPEQARQKLARSKHQAVAEALRTSTSMLGVQDPEGAFEAAVRDRLESADPAVLQEAWANGDIGLAQWSSLPIWFRLEITTDGKVFTLLSEGRLPQAVFEKFANDSQPRVRCLIAENPWTPPQVLEKLANDQSHDVRWNVAKNTNCPAHVRERLAKERKFLTRNNVARNPNSSPVVLEELAKDINSNIRCSVAENFSTPLHLIDLLANDKNSKVRSAISKRSTCPANLLERLARDADIFVRLNVASNPSTPGNVLESFWISGEKWFPEELAQNPSTPVYILEHLARVSNSSIRSRLAKNPTTPTHVLENFNNAKNLTTDMRLALASNAHRSDKIFKKLCHDPNKDVRSAVRRCKGLASEALEILFQEARDEGDWVDLLLNPALSSKSSKVLLESLFNTPATNSPWYQRELYVVSDEIRTAAGAGSVLSYPGKDPDRAVLSKRTLAPLMALCAGPFIEPSRLAKVVGATDWLVRAAVARNPGTPPNLLKKLSVDAHPLVMALGHMSQKKEESEPARHLGQSLAGLDLSRATEEILGRIPTDGVRERFGYLLKLFADDVWCEQLTAGQISWLTAALEKFPFEILPFRNFPPLKKLLSLDEGELMVETVVEFDKSLRGSDVCVRLWALDDPGCPVHVLKVLAKDKNPIVVLAVFRNPALPQSDKEAVRKVLHRLKGDKLADLLVSSGVSSQILSVSPVSKDGDSTAMTRNDSRPIHELEKMAEDPSPWVRGTAAGNIHTPACVLERLAKDSNEGVRSCVAGNISAPVHLLESLSKDTSSWIRGIVAKNSSSPDHIIEMLVKDLDYIVQRKAAQNSSLSARMLELLSSSPMIWVRSGIAENISAPVSILEVLSRDLNPRVRASVGKNEATPLPILLLLSEDASFDVRISFLWNPTPHAALRERFVNWWFARLQRSIRREMAVRQGLVVAESSHQIQPAHVAKMMDSFGWVRLGADNSALTKWSRSKDWLVRLGVALHPLASEGILKVLRKDSDCDVAHAAAMDRSLLLNVKSE